ncbi:MAG TPA: amino acid adenylation domain-containing protein, partial [Candidatus Binatia bacterium]
NAPERALSFEGVSVSRIRTGSETAKFDLTLSVHETAQGLTGSLQYNTDLFEAATITRLLKHFETLLQGIVDDPGQRIADLPILTGAEERQMLIDWRGAREGKFTFDDVVRMFEQQAERTPDALALAFDDISLTYDEVNRRANQLAQYLVKRGVRPESRVAICIERSAEFALGFLAILKAGGVYVPLDPSYPRDRLLEMIRDLGPTLLVTTQAQVSQCSLPSVTVIALNVAQESIAREDQANPQSVNEPQNAAYILYTSGSTGKPKGVVMSHGALGNLISWQVTNLSEPAAARTVQFAPCGFDVSIQEMLTTWCSGGALFLIKEELRRDGVSLLRFIQERSIERVFLPFVALQNIAAAAAYANCYAPSLREIITAGEQLQMTESVKLFLNKLGVCCLRNQYGPTESHVASEFVLRPSFDSASYLPPIGRPIANTKIYILDSYRRPVPVGVTGEIYIGGAGLARGYLNQPELTAEKFIEHSFHGETASRLYKTGDRARYLSDGTIEFLGRLDDQVKIRGYRVEPGEIEAALAQHRAVQSAVVMVRELAPMDKRLVSYVVVHENATLESKELRAYLKDRLPDYMVPSVFVFLDGLPLTTNGKLDRARLPTPEFAHRGEHVAPRTPVEERLARIWADLLRLDRVGADDNFFDLGGHSLLATQVVSRIAEAFRIALPCRALFERPTVAELSSHIEEIRAGEDADAVLKLSQDQAVEIIS